MNLGHVIDKRKERTIEASKSGATTKYNKPVDLLQILLDAEVGSGSSRGNAVSHLTMKESEEDCNSNFELDSNSNNFSPEISSLSARNYLNNRLENTQKHKDSLLSSPEHICAGKWSCPPGAPCEKPKTRLSLDVSYLSSYTVTRHFRSLWNRAYFILI